MVCNTLVTVTFTCFVEPVAAPFDDDHRAVVQIAHALPGDSPNLIR